MVLEIDMIVRLLVGVSLSLIIGLEREFKGVPAGLRTHTLVGLGATLFTILSLSFSGASTDVSRIASQVVVGIGFIGGGIIFKSESNIKGLTTAADLWVIAAIGIAAGAGHFFIASLTALIVMLVLIFGRLFETKTLRKKKVEW